MTNKILVKMSFLMDCTSSMGPWVDAAQSQMEAIVEKTRKLYPKASFLVSFVGYRDHGDLPQYSVLPFQQASTLVQKIREVAVFGGDDHAEDVVGGLMQARDQDWTGADVKMLVHICDAPCHGRQFHKPWLSDRYPAGDPDGHDPLEVLRELAHKGFFYTFVRITDATDLMIEAFHSVYNNGFTIVDLYPQEEIVRDDDRDYIRAPRARPDMLTPILVRTISDSITQHTSSQDPGAM